MQIKNESDIAYSLNRYFNQFEGYFTLKLDFMKDNEYWLYNPKATRFHFIRISYVENYELSNTVLININHNLHKQFTGMMSSISPILNICINYECNSEAINGILNYTVDGSMESLSLLSSFYPQLLKAYKQRKNMEYFQYDEKEQPRVTLKNRLLMQGAFLTKIILGFCIFMFAVGFALELLYSSENLLNTFVNYVSNGGVNSNIFLGAYYRTFVVANNEYWRFITSGFLHFGLLHLIVNMMALRNLGKFCEDVFGHKRFLAILFGSIFVGNCFAHLDSSTTLAAGISGGLFGLLAAYVVFVFQNKLYKNPRVLNALLFNLFLNLMISLMPSVSMASHLGGFVAGLFISVILYPNTRFGISKSFKINSLMASLILMVFIGIRVGSMQELDTLYGGTDFAIIEMCKDFYLPTKNLENNITKLYMERLK